MKKIIQHGIDVLRKCPRDEEFTLRLEKFSHCKRARAVNRTDTPDEIASDDTYFVAFKQNPETISLDTSYDFTEEDHQMQTRIRVEGTGANEGRGRLTTFATGPTPCSGVATSIEQSQQHLKQMEHYDNTIQINNTIKDSISPNVSPIPFDRCTSLKASSQFVVRVVQSNNPIFFFLGPSAFRCDCLCFAVSPVRVPRRDPFPPYLPTRATLALAVER